MEIRFTVCEVILNLSSKNFNNIFEPDVLNQRTSSIPFSIFIALILVINYYFSVKHSQNITHSYFLQQMLYLTLNILQIPILELPNKNSIQKIYHQCQKL